MKIQLKHSNVLNSGAAQQPTAPNMLDGEIAVNFNANDPAIFIKNSDGNIVRIAGKDNLAFTGYEAAIQAASTPPSGLEAGNLYFDTDDNRLYYYYNDGSSLQWVDASTEKFDVTIIPDPSNLNHQSGTLDDRYVNSNGDTMTGNLVLNAGVNINSSDIYLNNGKITFEGASANQHETNLTVIEPTADRTLSLPNTSGTLVSTGDTGTVTSAMIADGTIQNADISNTAAIGLSKLATGNLPSGITVASTNIADGAIVNADINASAAIALTKLGTGALPSGVTISSSGISGGVATTDIAAGALPNNVTIASTNIVDGSIVDADISNTASIQVSKLADGSSYQLLQTNAAGNDVEWASNIDIPGTLDVTGIATFDNNLNVAGNLSVTGSTISLDANIVTIKDGNIQLGVVSTPTDITADGGGVTLKGSTDKTLSWVNSTDAWTSSEHFNLANGKAYYVNGAEVLNGTSLGSSIAGSSLTGVGTISTGVWQGTQIVDTYLATLTGTGKVANSATTATNLNSGNAIVSRDGSGDFIARNITASLIGNAATSSKLANARTIALTGDLTGSASFDGSSNISISTTAAFVGTTNLSYNSTTRKVESDTGTDATLPLFSNTVAGLTGASGGGTVNYLRADGSWAVPPGIGTDLGYTAATSTITSSTGASVALPNFSSTNSGFVQGSGGGTTKFLRADGNWIELGSSSTSISVTPPSNPAPGDSWFDTDEGRTYIYYTDTDSSQWVESNPSWNGGIPVGSVAPNYLTTGGPNWDASGNLSATGSITAASGVITGTLTKGGSNVLTAGDTGTVTTAILADAAVTQAKLNDGSVSASKLEANSVTNAKIADGTITSAKLATEAVATTNITDVSVTTAKIADDAVTAAKLADTSVTAGSYTVSSITVDAQGRVTSASSGTVPAANKIIQGNTEAEVVDTGTNGHFQITTEGTERFRIDSSGSVIVKGDSTNGSGALTLNCENNSHGIKIKGPPHSAGANYTLTLPNNTGTNGQALITNGSGVSSWSTIDLSSKLSLTGGTLTGGLTGTTANFSGNVGIGTSAPGRILDVTSAGSAEIKLTDSTNIGRDMYIKNNDGAFEFRSRDRNSNGTFVFLGYGGETDTERMRIDSSGKVYFGNFSDVANAGYIDKATTGDLELNIVASRSTAQNRNIVFKGRSNTEAMRIDSSGRVGIGTSSPTVSNGNGLHIAGGNAGIKLQNTNNGDWAYVEYADESNTTKFIQGYRDQSGVYAIRPGTSLNATPGLSLDSSGNIGIGVSPSTKLHVGGSTPTFRVSHGTSQIVELKADTGASILRTTTNHPLLFGTNDNERMRIDSSGRLLLGTTTAYGSSDNFVVQKTDGGARIGLQRSDTGQVTAGEELGAITFYSNDGDLNPSAQISAQADLAHAVNDKPGRLTFSTTADNDTGPTERMRIDSSGNVGIGTSSPAKALEIFRDSFPCLMLNDGDQYKSYMQLGMNSLEIRGSSGNIEFYTGSNDGLSSTERMRINSSGNVYIGGTSAGTAKVAFHNYGGSDFYYATSNAAFDLANWKTDVGSTKTTVISFKAGGSSTFAGTVTANAFSGDGSALTNLPSAGVSIGLAIALG